MGWGKRGRATGPIGAVLSETVKQRKFLFETELHKHKIYIQNFIETKLCWSVYLCNELN